MVSEGKDSDIATPAANSLMPVTGVAASERFTSGPDDRLRILLHASEILGDSLDPETTLQHLTRFLVPRLADGCVVDVVDDGNRVRRLSVIHDDPSKADWAAKLMRLGPPDPSTPRGILAILAAGEPLLAPDVTPESLVLGARNAEHLEILCSLGLRSAMILPMVARGRSVGVLWLYSTGNRRYTSEDLVLGRDVARRAALAMDNARLYELAQESIRARDVFLSVAAHELRTPVTALRLQNDLLYRSASRMTTDRLQRAAQVSERQIERLTKLMNSLFDVSRIGAKQLELVVEAFDLGALAREVSERFAPEFTSSTSSLELEISGELLGRWDRSRIDQVVTNLLSNAVKYGLGKPIQLRVVGDGSNATVSVRDEGIGIDACDHARIFERYERATSEKNYGGLGMGLWIAREIVEAHGGCIALESEPGAGATFTFSLPRRMD